MLALLGVVVFAGIAVLITTPVMASEVGSVSTSSTSSIMATPIPPYRLYLPILLKSSRMHITTSYDGTWVSMTIQATFNAPGRYEIYFDTCSTGLGEAGVNPSDGRVFCDWNGCGHQCTWTVDVCQSPQETFWVKFTGQGWLWVWMYKEGMLLEYQRIWLSSTGQPSPTPSPPGLGQ